MRHDELSGHEPDSGIFALVQAARTAMAQLSPEQRRRGELAIVRNTEQTRAKRAPRQLRLLVAFILACVGAAFVLRQVIAPAALSYFVDIGSANEAQLTQTIGTSASILRFSDGTEIRLSKETRAHGDFVPQKSAVLTIDQGSMHAKVNHFTKPERWFEAGPFSVNATGAVFDLDWQPEQDRLELRVESGNVSVTAPVSKDPVQVRAGERLTIKSKNSAALIEAFTAGTDIARTRPFLQH